VAGENCSDIMTRRANGTVALFGAYGRTGRFVISELRRRGLTPILSGRDAAKLKTVGDAHPGSEARVASIDDPASLDRAISGAAAIINCAGPFIDTAAPIIEAAIRGRIHYLDVTAEQRAVLDAFERFADTARDAGVVIAPAMAFYGGLDDLLATAAMDDWPDADEICVAIALDSWKPTRGTRLTGKRNTGRRFVFSNNKLEFLADPAPRRAWNFPAPFGTQDVEGFGYSEIITISRHLQTPEIHAFMNLAPLTDLRNPDTPEPVAADESGRSSQTFLVEVVARRRSEERRAIARGRDIYAITAPIVVEAAERILDGRFKRKGIGAPAEIFDARDFLGALAPEHLTIEIP
jgi:Saccharopine dehydrogenase NADP binding domain